MPDPPAGPNPQMQRLRAAIRGAVQGVGFRPYVYRLATSLGLAGWVLNSPQGVFLEVEGSPDRVRAFLLRLEPERPPRASIQSLESSLLDPVGYEGFEIRPSEGAGERTAIVLPDLATCPDCLADIRDPANRRFRYAFTNCTNCGPRYSIVRALPYDRPNTTMARFVMCPECQAEYDDPLNRRFHAQPNACPRCGPQLALWGPGGEVLAAGDDALRQAEQAILAGRIVALKGLGGFQLIVDARSEAAVALLRQRKRREEKPFAVMAPSLDWAQAHCEVSDLEARLLASAEAPIVLLGRRDTTDGTVAASVAPGNPTLGVMLPYTPLHHLLLADIGIPIVATSGNLSDEPICTGETEALERLAGIADLFLVHDRPIARHVDDSVARVMLDREMVMRRARGYAPLPVPLPAGGDGARPAAVLAVGAHLKNSIALAVGDQAFCAQHVGDLETAQAYDAFRREAEDLQRLYETPAEAVACDLHPDYLSTQYAERLGLPAVAVQHHYAHALACIAENEVPLPALGVSWDGTGLGTDGTIWGGEFLRVDGAGFERVAHLRPFRLPGGDRAVREPRRAALGVLYELMGDAAFEQTDLAPIRAFEPRELNVLKTALHRGVNAPVTTSAGRLFDAVAALAGLRQTVRHEGQAAMELEFAAAELAASTTSYALDVHDSPQGGILVDWAPLVARVLADVRRSVPVAQIAAGCHDALARAVAAVAQKVGCERVVLSGGCFQNRILTERTVAALQTAGCRPYWHQRIPPNDGGIALGQAAAARRHQPQQKE